MIVYDYVTLIIILYNYILCVWVYSFDEKIIIFLGGGIVYNSICLSNRLSIHPSFYLRIYLSVNPVVSCLILSVQIFLI
jgi:hypothetical protein